MNNSNNGRAINVNCIPTDFMGLMDIVDIERRQLETLAWGHKL